MLEERSKLNFARLNLEEFGGFSLSTHTHTLSLVSSPPLSHCSIVGSVGTGKSMLLRALLKDSVIRAVRIRRRSIRRRREREAEGKKRRDRDEIYSKIIM